jgi:hypothetical protein
MRASHRPFWWRVTPRNLDVPREKPLLWRRSDSTSSSVDTWAQVGARQLVSLNEQVTAVTRSMLASSCS